MLLFWRSHHAAYHKIAAASNCLASGPAPGLNLGQVPACVAERLHLSPQDFLIVTNAGALADWAITASRWWSTPYLRAPRRGPKTAYPDTAILFMGFIQIAWRMAYHAVLEYVNEHLALVSGMSAKGSTLHPIVHAMPNA